REIGDRAGVGRLLNNMALTSRKLGKDTQALIYFQQAIPMLEATGDNTGIGRLLNNMGAIHESLGQSAKALESYEQALKIARDGGDKAGETTAMEGIKRLSSGQIVPQ
ncbi:MAG: tetratricopeptide repeat protein, partial [Cyanobacteriota bacterium]|nr:tetratricopeptide repeat protein [Cyanobacteriota bacterium]